MTKNDVLYLIEFTCTAVKKPYFKDTKTKDVKSTNSDSIECPENYAFVRLTFHPKPEGTGKIYDLKAICQLIEEPKSSGPGPSKPGG